MCSRPLDPARAARPGWGGTRPASCRRPWARSAACRGPPGRGRASRPGGGAASSRGTRTIDRTARARRRVVPVGGMVVHRLKACSGGFPTNTAPHPLLAHEIRLNTGTGSIPRLVWFPMSLDRDVIAASKAWPIQEAQRLLERIAQRPPAKGFVLFETGYGPSGLPHIGTFAEVFRTTLVRQAFQRAFGPADRALRLLRRHGRAAQGAGQCPEPGDGDRASRPAADRDPRSVRHARELRRAHERAAEVVPRPVRLCLQLQERQRGVPQGRLQHGTPEGAGAARRDPRRGAADAGAGAAGHLLADPADLAHDRPRAAGADRGVPAGAGYRRVPRRGREADRAAGHRRPLQDAVEGRLGAALGGTRRRLRDVGQGPDRFGQALDPDLPPARRRAAREPDLRAVPGREGPEDQQVQGQRADHRGVADLRHAREPPGLPLPRAQEGQAPACRRDPAQRRRLRGLSRRLPGPAAGRAGRQPALAHP